MSITSDIIAALSPGARLMLPMIESLTEQGKTSAAITEALQEEFGKALRRTDLLTVIRAFKGITSSRTYLQAIRNEFRPDPSRLPPPVTRTLRAFSFKVRITGRDVETGEQQDHFVTISSSRLLTAQEIKSAAVALVPNIDEGTTGSPTVPELESPAAVIHTGTFQP